MTTCLFAALLVASACGLFAEVAAHSAAPLVTLSNCSETVMFGSWRTVSQLTGLDQEREVNVAAFRAIPYAAAPIGDRRFAASETLLCPLTPTGKGGIFNASLENGGPKCPQWYNGPTSDPDQSEDCLYLNVFVPSTNIVVAPPQPLPVFVYLHGGNLVSGSGAFEDLAFWAANANGNRFGEAITVSINYRLGLLGFLSTPAFGPAANFGLGDVLTALRWVKANIAAFGGNPSSVTVVGHSSGATLGMALLGTPSASGLFHALVALSGSPNTTMPLVAKQSQDAPLLASLGCGGNSSSQGTAEATMHCLRALPTSAFVTATPPSWNDPANSQLAMASPQVGSGIVGVLCVDGSLLQSSLADAIGPSGLPVPVILSSMGQEMNLVAGPPQLQQPDVGPWTATFREFLESQLKPGWGDEAPLLASALQASYAPKATCALQAYLTLTADYGVGCAFQTFVDRLQPQPSFERGTKASNSNSGSASGPTVFVLENQWPPALPHNNSTRSFAFHAWDWWCATAQFVHPAFPFVYMPSQDDWALSSLLRSLWYQLALSAADITNNAATALLVADPPVAVGGPLVTWAPAVVNGTRVPRPRTLRLNRRDRYPFSGTVADGVWADRSIRCGVLVAGDVAVPGNWWSN